MSNLLKSSRAPKGTETPLSVTVVVSQRERFESTPDVIREIHERAGVSFKLICALVQPPGFIVSEMKTLANEYDFQLVVFDEWRWPSAVRADISQSIETQYVCFIDNDVSVSKNWLSTLVCAAEETRAGIIGPVYLIRDVSGRDKVHMSGGDLIYDENVPSKITASRHRNTNADLSTIENLTERQVVDYVEFHCLLMRQEVARLPAVFGVEPASIKEHVHASLVARENGYQTVLEPRAIVTHVAGAPLVLSSLRYFRKRWDLSDNDRSAEAFCRHWSYAEGDEIGVGIKTYVRRRIAEVDPLMPLPDWAPWRSTALPNSFMPQTPGALLDLMASRCYNSTEIAIVSKGYQLAQVLFNGLYRGCGRPFINHLVGVASILAYYGFRPTTINAALLHSAYSHTPMKKTTQKQGATDVVENALQRCGQITASCVYAYSQRRKIWSDLIDSSDLDRDMTVLDAEVIAIAAANDLEMALSGEYRHTGRQRAPQGIDELARHALQELGVSGLLESFEIAREIPVQHTPLSATGMRHSYRLTGSRKVRISGGNDNRDVH